MKKVWIRSISVIMVFAMLSGVLMTAHAADVNDGIPGESVLAANAFKDVPDGIWYSQAAAFSSASGLMVGTGDGKFSPEMKLDRAMCVTVLYRLAGSPDVSNGNSFSDVPEDSYYASAVSWALEEGVTFGTGETTFSPLRNITREELACMIARYVTGINAAFLDGDSAEQYFADQGAASAFAADAVELMRKTGLFVGDGAGNFRPQAETTRAEAAMVFMRLALKLDQVPSQAVLEICDPTGEVTETYTVSVKDTVTLYTLLTSSVWERRDYAEYVPTHILTLWNGQYRFDLPDDAQGYDGVNYVHDNIYGGLSAPDGLLLPAVRGIFENYTG